MYRRSITIALTVTLLLLVPPVSGGAQIQQVPSPYTYTVATIDAPLTLDPHWAYDTAGEKLIFNVYETLIDFMGGRTDEFIPELATDWTISPDGLTYTFTIRTGITFTDGSSLTPEDVEYSFERGMVRDPSGGPMWMLYEPLIGVIGSRSYGDLSDPAVAAELGQLIDAAIESNATHVTFSLAAAGVPYPPFMQILSQSWASILDREYMVSIDDWPGFDVTGYVDWVIYNDYQYEVGLYGFRVSPLDYPAPNMMGTGPFTFTEWIKGAGGYTRLDRNAGYWGGWPAGAPGTAREGDFKPSRGYIDTYIEFNIAVWASRIAGFIAGTYDSIYVPRFRIPTVWQLPGIESIYPKQELALDAIFFNFNIADGISYMSPYVGTEEFDANNDGTPDGIPLNFFNDTDVRKGFAYAFNYAGYLNCTGSTWLSEAQQPATPIIEGLAFYNSSTPKYSQNLALARAHFSMAWGGIDANGDGDALDPGDTPGQVWSKGFRFTIPYIYGNEEREAATRTLVTAVTALNVPLFKINLQGILWPLFLDGLWCSSTNYRSVIPLFVGGWQGDFADAHDFVTAFMASYGYYGYPTSYSNATVDALIEQGIAETDPTARNAIYNQLNQLYIQEVPSVPIAQALGRRWQRDWVQGWNYNPLSTGSAAARIGDVDGSNFYTIWKEDLPREDVNEDGKVNIADLTVAAKAFGSEFVQPHLPPPQVGIPGTFSDNWYSRADINQDKKVNIMDLTKMAKLFGYTAPPWTPP